MTMCDHLRSGCGHSGTYRSNLATQALVQAPKRDRRRTYELAVDARWRPFE